MSGKAVSALPVGDTVRGETLGTEDPDGTSTPPLQEPRAPRAAYYSWRT